MVAQFSETLVHSRKTFSQGKSKSLSVSDAEKMLHVQTQMMGESESDSPDEERLSD